VKINNSYEVQNFGGTKSIVLSSTNELGGTNYFLAYSYLGVGSLCVLLSFVFAGIHFKSGRRQ
jgi:hypothetical protein